MIAGIMETSPVKLSIVIPVYNAEVTLGSLCAQLKEVCEDLPITHEIVLVDDASTDASASMLQVFSQEYPNVRVHRLESNRGQAAALATGTSLASGNRIIIMDDDLQHPPKHIPILMETQVRAGGNTLAIVTPKRRRRELWRSLLGRASNVISNLFLQKPLPLRMTSFCCFSRQLAPELSTFAGAGGPWLVHLVQRADRVITVPLELQRSEREKSRYTFASLTALFFSRARYFSPARTAAITFVSAGLMFWCVLQFGRQPSLGWGAATAATFGVFDLSALFALSVWRERRRRS